MRRIFISLAALFASLGGQVYAQDQSPNAAQDKAIIEQRARDVVAVINEELPYEAVFASAFVNAIPESQFRQLLDQMSGQLGEFIGLDSVQVIGARKATLSLRFTLSTISGPMDLEMDAPYQISGLLLNDITPILEEGQTAIDELRALSGTTNLLFARLDGSQIHAAHNADLSLAIGSTFKLYILSELVRQIEAGERSWSDVVALDQKSLPSGVMQDWPTGTPVTIHTLATHMISISDNTATDQLMAVLGREAIERELIASGHSDPTATLPMMSTREMFILKMSEDQALADYLAADQSTRRNVLNGLAGQEADFDGIERVFGAGPRFLELEWFSSPQDIRLIYNRIIHNRIAREILSINRGFASGQAQDWPYIGFKGGSEPGVMNLSWILQDAAGEFHVLSLSWNNPEDDVSEIRLMGLASLVLKEYLAAQR